MSDTAPLAAIRPPAPMVLELAWDGDLRFRGTAGAVSMVMDSASEAGPSPVQALAFALAGCMAMDLVHILGKGRVDVKGVHARLVGERAPDNPKRIVAMRLHFVVKGDVPAEKIDRALSLSRETYCSVWHSLRQDIDFRTSYVVE